MRIISSETSYRRFREWKKLCLHAGLSTAVKKGKRGAPSSQKKATGKPVALNKSKKLLHLGKGNRTGRAYAGAGLAAFAKISLLCECLAVLHHENADRTVIHTLFTRFAL
jgi:hypothetical protein